MERATEMINCNDFKKSIENWEEVEQEIGPVQPIQLVNRTVTYQRDINIT